MVQRGRRAHASSRRTCGRHVDAQQVDYAQFESETLEIVDYVKKQMAKEGDKPVEKARARGADASA
jgi:hypothetical protein